MRVKLAAILLLSTSLAAQTPQRGVFAGDVDRSVDACTNFFDYANGAWRKANPIPAHMSRWSRRWESGELSKDQLRVLLDDLSRRKDWPKGSIDQQITDFYGSCMDEKRINALGIKPIEPLLRDIDRITTRTALQDMIGRLSELQVAAPFGITAQPDNHNPRNVIAYVFAAGLSLPGRDYYFKTEPRFVETREKYREHVANMFRLAGSGKAEAAKAAETVLAMETRLARMHFDNVQLRNPRNTDHMYMVATLQKMTPHFNWANYLERAGVSVQELNVAQPLFMIAVDEELTKTPLAAWRTYLRWRVLNSASEYLSEPFVNESFNFYGKYLNGAKEMKVRSTRCVEATDQFLGEALGQRYVERHFTPEAKARMQEMVRNILSAMGDVITNLEWMGPETKKEALTKLSTFNPKVGYPDKWTDYSSVTIVPDAYVENVMTGLRFLARDDRGQIGKPTDRGRWGMTPPTSNAYYNPLLNEIVFPAGILQSPGFDVNATDAVNYGAIGVVIGHEISHGFDDQGAQYDAEGRLRNWWTEEDLKRFRERGACVAQQFEGYEIEPGIAHRGNLVLGESIGDLAGAKIAWLGLQKAQAKNPGKTIDGFTPDQQFFLAWGQFRGDEIRPEAQRVMVQRGPHPTGKYRVIGPLSNMPEFARAFGCAAKAVMVRPEGTRCEVW